MKFLTRVALIVLLPFVLTACKASKDQTYGSVEDLRVAFEEAGGTCDGWTENDAITLALESGECGNTVLSIYENNAEALKMVKQHNSVIGSILGSDALGKMLIGPNWVVNSDEDLTEVQDSMGGRIKMPPADVSPQPIEETPAAPTLGDWYDDDRDEALIEDDELNAQFEFLTVMENTHPEIVDLGTREEFAQVGLKTCSSFEQFNDYKKAFSEAKSALSEYGLDWGQDDINDAMFTATLKMCIKYSGAVTDHVRPMADG